jgi:hypothetical protein
MVLLLRHLLGWVVAAFRSREDLILAGTKGTAKPAEDVPEPYDHAKNLTGTLPIELGAKSLILWVYDVLMNDRSRSGELCVANPSAHQSRYLSFTGLRAWAKVSRLAIGLRISKRT